MQGEFLFISHLHHCFPMSDSLNARQIISKIIIICLTHQLGSPGPLSHSLCSTQLDFLLIFFYFYFFLFYIVYVTLYAQANFLRAVETAHSLRLQRTLRLLEIHRPSLLTFVFVECFLGFLSCFPSLNYRAGTLSGSI